MFLPFFFLLFLHLQLLFGRKNWLWPIVSFKASSKCTYTVIDGLLCGPSDCIHVYMFWPHADSISNSSELSALNLEFVPLANPIHAHVDEAVARDVLLGGGMDRVATANVEVLRRSNLNYRFLRLDAEWKLLVSIRSFWSVNIPRSFRAFVCRLRTH